MKYRAIAGVICFSVMLSGCGSISGRHGIDSGYAYIEKREYAKALESFAEAEANGEDACLTHRGKGIAYLNTNEYSQAVEEFHASLDTDNGIVDDMDFDTNYYIAEAYMKLGDYDNALETYNAILDLRDRDSNAYYLRGVCELAQDAAAGNGAPANGEEKSEIAKSAAEDFNNAIRYNPKDYSLTIMIYKAYSEYHYDEDAVAVLQNALSTGQSSMTNYEKGQLYFYLGDNAESQKFLSKAAKERNQDKENAVILLGMIEERREDYDAAIRVYKPYLSDNPKSAKVFNKLGMCQIKLGDYSLAQGNYDGAMESYNDAVTSFEQGLALNNNLMNQPLMLNRITAYEHMGKFNLAQEEMSKYLELYPSDDEAVRENIFISTR